MAFEPIGRTNWYFHYRADELHVAAYKRLLGMRGVAQIYQAALEEYKHRQLMSDMEERQILYKEMVEHENKLAKLLQEITDLAVFVNEFARDDQRHYRLTPADVEYFGLVPGDLVSVTRPTSDDTA